MPCSVDFQSLISSTMAVVVVVVACWGTMVICWDFVEKGYFPFQNQIRIGCDQSYGLVVDPFALVVPVVPVAVPGFFVVVAQAVLFCYCQVPFVLLTSC